MPKVSIDDMKVLPGQKKYGAIKVGELPDTTDILVPIIVINGKTNGSVVVVSSAIHGDEVNGTEICYQLARSIDPETLRGTVILLPICNPLAFNARSRCAPMDNKDLNRCFPGDKSSSITSKVAYVLFESVFKKADYIIDLHSGSSNFRLVPHVRTFSSDMDCMDLARAFGFDFIIMRKGSSGSIAVEALHHGIKSVVVELGEGNRLESDYVEVGINGLKRVLVHLRMVSGQQRLHKSSKILNERVYVRAPTGGIIVPLKREGESVIKKELVAEVHNPYSESVVNVKAPTDGYIIGVRRNPQAFTGDGIILIYR
jgi:predicted deacylase